MSLNDFSTVIVASEGPALTQVGFGTLLITAYFPSSVLPDLTTVVTAKADLTDNGLASNHPAVLALERALQQSPQPSPIKIGRLEHAPVPSIRLTPVASNATVYGVTLEVAGEDDEDIRNPVDISITSDSDATVDEICDALATAILDVTGAGEDLEDLSVASVGGTGATGGTSTAIDLSMAAGRWFYARDWRRERIKLEDRTPDPGIDSDMSAIRSYDADWYHLATAHNSTAILKEQADWAETQRVLFFCNTSDWGAGDLATTDDIQTQLADVSYARTMCTYDGTGTDGFAGVGSAAERAPFDPGAPPYAGGDFNAKTLKGVRDNRLSPDLKANLLSKGYTVIENTSGRVHTLGGDAAGGKPMDQTRFEDWFAVRLQERIAKVELDSGKIPMNKKGLAQYESLCRAQISAGIASGGINEVDSDGNEPTVSIPTLGQIPPNDRAARVLGGPGIVIDFQYSSGIRHANIGVFVRL